MNIVENRLTHEFFRSTAYHKLEVDPHDPDNVEAVRAYMTLLGPVGLEIIRKELRALDESVVADKPRCLDTLWDIIGDE